MQMLFMILFCITFIIWLGILIIFPIKYGFKKCFNIFESNYIPYILTLNIIMDLFNLCIKYN